MRSSQMDAARLDDELKLMLQEQFLGAFSLFPKVNSWYSTVGSRCRMASERLTRILRTTGSLAGALHTIK